MSLRASLAASVCFGALAANAHAGPIVDQFNTPTPSQGLSTSSLAPIGQEFVPNHTAVEFIDVRIADVAVNAGAGADMQVRLRLDTIGGTILGTSAVVHAQDNQSAYYRFNFASPVAVIPAERYVLEVVNVNNVLNYSLSKGQLDSYAPGRPIVEGSTDNNFTNTVADFLFQSGRSTNTGSAMSGTFGAFAYRSVRDADHDGDGDALNGGSFVARNDQQLGLNSPSEDRAVFEYDVTRFAGGVQSASVSGTLFVNNSIDTGPRTVRLELFDGDGNITVSDFQVAASSSGTFTYQPPADSSVPFTIDITAQLNALLAGGADFLGARFIPTGDQAPSVFSDQTGTPVLNVTVPEPGAIALTAMTLGVALLRRQRTA